MENHVGEIYEGIVSGVTAWGLFVELDNSCEGMISAASMADDFYIYDEQNIRLVGERSGKEYTLGQKVTVRVLAADRITRNIDFRIVGEDEDEDELLQQEPERVEYTRARKATEDRARKLRKLSGRAEESKGRKVYKVHKYKKSATSKAARSAQGKDRRRKH